MIRSHSKQSVLKKGRLRCGGFAKKEALAKKEAFQTGMKE